jgi:carbamoyltransferase
MTAILGISAFYHDSAAALVIDGDIVAAAQEERFTRIKNDHAFPTQAIAYCLREAGLPVEKLDYVAFYDKPYLKFGRLLETYLSYAPVGLSSFQQAVPLWLRHKLHMPGTIRKGLGGRSRAPLVFLDHHESHAASAFFPSPFDEAAILTLDGVGEWSTTTMGIARGNKIELFREVKFPHSLGLLYSAFTYYCGFKVNSGEYKLMGLAPYGQPIYKDTIYEHLLELKPDGSFWMNMDYFNYCQGLTMTNERLHDLFGGPPRQPDMELQQRHMDLASSIQAVTEDAILTMGRELHRQTGMKKLVMAGGVALNCVANGKLLRQGPFSDIWIQPAAGDAGGALGAALFVWYQLLEKPRRVTSQDFQKGSFLGPSYELDGIRKFLNEKGAVYQHFRDEDELLGHVAQQMVEEKVVGWLHGRMEFGPRALGARSILGDPRSPRIQATMNLKIKFRESFRPFAPCVLRDHVHEWFQMRPQEDSPYMLLVAPVLEERRVPLSPVDQERMRSDPDLLRRVNVVRSQVPAITHVDFSARVQTVDERHGRFYRLMKKFHEKTGCPIIVNTSFNLSWEPIVESPQEAYHTFMQSEMDVLVLEDCVLHKAHQPPPRTVPGVGEFVRLPGGRQPAQPAAKSVVLSRGRRVPPRDRSKNARSGFAIDPLLVDHDQPALSNSLLRQFAVLWLLFCGGFAYLSYTRERLTAACVVAGLGLAFGPLGFLRPKFIRPLFVLLTTLTSPIGWLVSRVFLAVLYYGVFTPFALLFRLIGRDILCRHKQPDRDSFWTARRATVDIESYFRQS